MQTKEILVEIIEYIEENIHDKITIEDIAEEVYLSQVHLQRIFSFVFDVPVAEYIRSRKLQKALELLYDTDRKICDIAYSVGFGYESSFIRSFKREFGITPKEARKNPHILKIVPPLSLDAYSDVRGGIMSDYDFVMLPNMTVVGKNYIVPFADSVEMAPEVAKNFWEREMPQIEGKISDGVYIGLTRFAGAEADYSYYLPSVPVEADTKVAKGLEKQEIMSTAAVRFRYVGHHHYYDINADIANVMYAKIDDFLANTPDNVVVPFDYYFEKINIHDYDGEYCMMEWYTPVILLDDV